MVRKKSGGNRFRLTYVLLGFAFLGLAGNWLFKHYLGRNQETALGGMPEGFAMPVETQKVKQETLSEEALTVGTLEGDESVMIRPEIAGRVVEIIFQEGQHVARGDILVKLDDSIYAADVAESQAALAFSEAQNQRQNSLYQKNYTSGGKKDEAISKFKVDEAILNRKKAVLEKTKVIAPFEGVIGLRKISIGDYVSPGQDIAALVRLDPLKVRFSLPEVYLLSLKPGQKIEITSDILPGKKYEGEILALDPVINESGRNIEIKGFLPNKDFLLRPGLFVRVRVVLSIRKNALLIPEEAIMMQGDKLFVYKVVEGKAKRVHVTSGMRSKSLVEIVHGLSSHDEVITAGQIKIRDGMPVKPVPQEKSKEV